MVGRDVDTSAAPSTGADRVAEDNRSAAEPAGMSGFERDVPGCVICGEASTTHRNDPVPVWTYPAEPPRGALPPLQLCDAHWGQYRNDWLLIGWCVDHYGEALRRCDRHGREIPPL